MLGGLGCTGGYLPYKFGVLLFAQRIFRRFLTDNLTDFPPYVTHVIVIFNIATQIVQYIISIFFLSTVQSRNSWLRIRSILDPIRIQIQKIRIKKPEPFLHPDPTLRKCCGSGSEFGNFLLFIEGTGTVYGREPYHTVPAAQRGNLA